MIFAEDAGQYIVLQLSLLVREEPIQTHPFMRESTYSRVIFSLKADELYSLRAVILWRLDIRWMQYSARAQQYRLPSFLPLE